MKKLILSLMLVVGIFTQSGTGFSQPEPRSLTQGQEVGGTFYETPPTLLDGQQIGLQLDETGALRVSGSGAGSSITSVVPGTGATNLGKAVGNAGGATDTGVAGLALRDDATTTLSDPDGDYSNLRVNARGALWVTLDTALSHTIDTIRLGDGTNTALVDACQGVAKTTTPISLTADTIIIAATAAKKNYICAISIVASAAEIVSITEGTGATCGTSEAALVGSTTDANGLSLAANGGFVMGDGNSAVINGITANVDTCLNVSGANRVAGFVTWVQR